MQSFKRSQLLQKRQLLLLTLTVLLVPAIFSCAVPIKEENFYTDEGDNGAVITHFFATDSEDISKAAWDSIREGMTCESADAIGDIKAEFEQLCSRVSCNQVTSRSPLSTKDVAEFRQAVYELNQFIKRLPNGNAKDFSR